MDDAEILRRALELVSQRLGGEAGNTTTLRQLYDAYEKSRLTTPGWRVIGPALRRIMNTRYAPDMAPLGDRVVSSLRVHDWTDYRTYRLAKKNTKGRGVGDHAMNVELQYLKTLFNWAVAEQRIPANPISSAKPYGKKSRRKTAPTEAELAAMLRAADDRGRYMLLASSDGLMRNNELRLCRHEWVDVDNKEIHLAGEVCKRGKARDVPLTSRLLDAIRTLPRHLHSGLILHNDYGEPYDNSTLSRWYRLLADECGVKAAPGDRRAHLHDQRRQGATRAVRGNVPLPAIQAALGHDKIETTMIYVEMDPADITAASEAIEAQIRREQQSSVSEKSRLDK